MKLGGGDIDIVDGGLRVTSAPSSSIIGPDVASAESGIGLDVLLVTLLHALKSRFSVGCEKSDPDSDPCAGSIAMD